MTDWPTTYTRDLEELKRVAELLPNTRMLSLAKIHALVLLNMRLEPVMFDKNLKRHPYDIAGDFLQNAIRELRGWQDIGWIEDKAARQETKGKASGLEEKHHALFQDLWVNFSRDEYEERIQRYIHRLRVNGLGDGFLKEKRVIDFGCGHGNFAHACVRSGAAYALGIDYGEQSIEYATRAKEELKEARVEFKVESVYKVAVGDETFDFAIQNGVFHHLEDENAAIREMRRVLKRGGHIWYYTDGAGGLWYDMWDASCWILRNVPHQLIVEHLKYLNIETGKRYHLGDGLNATYRHTTWEEITKRLATHGFGEFKRLKGGFPTDFDDDVVVADRYGKEKWGSGDLRLLAKKL